MKRFRSRKGTDGIFSLPGRRGSLEPTFASSLTLGATPERRCSLDPTSSGHLLSTPGGRQAGDPPLRRLRDRRVSVANENPSRHATNSMLLTGSAIILSPSSGLPGLPLSDEWQPDAPPVRSSLPHIGFSARNDDWNRVQQAVLSMFRRETIEPSDLVTLVTKVRDLSKSDIGPFIYDYYKNQLLRKGMGQLREAINKNIENSKGELESVGEAWDYFYKETLPLLHYILHSISTKDLTIKQATLVEFRDNVLMRYDLEDWLQKRKDDIPANVRQMLLVLHSVPENEPPSQEFLKLESLVALTVSPFLGYRGLYMGDLSPMVTATRVDPNVRRKRSTAKDPGRPSSMVIPAITIDLHTGSSPDHSHSFGQYSRQGSHPSMASLTPVVEQEATAEHRRHSFTVS